LSLLSITFAYPIDSSAVSVSGLSSGGFMAVQYHVAYSSEVMGSGTFAGGPYYCAQAQLSNAFTQCMYGIMLDVNKLISITKSLPHKDIDDIVNLTNARVFLYSGARDSVVYPSVMKGLDTYYKAFTDSKNIKTSFNIQSEHCQPTDNFGNACTTKGTPYINNCNYDGAGDALQWIYGTLTPKVTPIKNNMLQLDQSKFIPPGYTTSSLSVYKYAYAYIPTGCKGNMLSEGKCKLHIAFHGCIQTIADIGDKFYMNAGYNGWAEANNIVVLYPQAAKSSFMPTNPNGCWDWWGYVSYNYAYKDGPQMQMVRNMAHSLMN